MKKNNLIIIILLLSVLLSVCWYKYSSINPDFIADFVVRNKCVPIASVAQKTKDIDSNLSKYSLTTKDILNKSSQGGEQTRYELAGKALLVKQVFYGETGKAEATYYMKDNKVFYFKKINYEYVAPLSQDTSGNVKNIDTKEFYLDSNQSLCSWYLNKTLQANDVDTKDLVQYLTSRL